MKGLKIKRERREREIKQGKYVTGWLFMVVHWN